MSRNKMHKIPSKIKTFMMLPEKKVNWKMSTMKGFFLVEKKKKI